MATYSSNSTIKVNAAVSASATRTSTGTTTVYTAPANGYALAQYNIITTLTGAVQITVAGQQIYYSASATATSAPAPFYVGPSQAVVIGTSGVSAGSVTVNISGVEFVNTP